MEIRRPAPKGAKHTVAFGSIAGTRGQAATTFLAFAKEKNEPQKKPRGPGMDRGARAQAVLRQARNYRGCNFSAAELMQ
jgi:hypothetical protein